MKVSIPLFSKKGKTNFNLALHSVQAQYDQIYRDCLKFTDTLVKDTSLDKHLKEDLIAQIKYADDFNNTYLNELVTGKISFEDFRNKIDGFGRISTPTPAPAKESSQNNMEPPLRRIESASHFEEMMKELEEEDDDFHPNPGPSLGSDESDNGEIEKDDRKENLNNEKQSLKHEKVEVERERNSEVQNSRQEAAVRGSQRSNSRIPVRKPREQREVFTPSKNYREANNNESEENRDKDELNSLDSIDKEVLDEVNPFKKVLENVRNKKGSGMLRGITTPTIPLKQSKLLLDEEIKGSPKFTPPRSRGEVEVKEMAELQLQLKEAQVKLEKAQIKIEKQNYYLDEKDKEVEFLRTQLAEQTLESERLSDENNHLIKELETLTKAINEGNANFQHAENVVHQKEISSLQQKLEQEKKRAEAYKDRMESIKEEQQRQKFQILEEEPLEVLRNDRQAQDTDDILENQPTFESVSIIKPPTSEIGVGKRSVFVQKLIDEVEESLKKDNKYMSPRETTSNQRGSFTSNQYKLNRDWLNFDVKKIISQPLKQTTHVNSERFGNFRSGLQVFSSMDERLAKMKFDRYSSFQGNIQLSNARQSVNLEEYRSKEGTLRHLGVVRSNLLAQNNDNTFQKSPQKLKFQSEIHRQKRTSGKATIGMAKSRYLDALNNFQHVMVENSAAKMRSTLKSVKINNIKDRESPF